MTKAVKTTILISMLLVPLGYFLVYPNYNQLIGPIKRFNIQRSIEEITFQMLTQLAPSKDAVLGVSIQSSDGKSIEESLSSHTTIDRKILEELNTKIIIKSIDVEGLVYEGVDAHTMNKGFWHFPPSNLPGQRGNMVVIGHRYAKLPPDKDTFFNLDKVKVGDKIEVVQSDNKFIYIVTETKVVEKHDISVLQDYSDYRITLITCSPLWTSKQRLVIVGKLDKLYKNT